LTKPQKYTILNCFAPIFHVAQKALKLGPKGITYEQAVPRKTPKQLAPRYSVGCDNHHRRSRRLCSTASQLPSVESDDNAVHHAEPLTSTFA